VKYLRRKSYLYHVQPERIQVLCKPYININLVQFLRGQDINLNPWTWGCDGVLYICMVFALPFAIQKQYSIFCSQSTMRYLSFNPLPIFISLLLITLSLVESSPQSGGWDKATGKDHVGKRPLPSSDNLQSINSTPSTGEKEPPHFKDMRHRGACDLTLDDEKVCPTGQACVADPFRSIGVKRNTDGNRVGVCTLSISINMCGGFAGGARKCSNDVNGWKCAEPGRCKRENTSNCDWLCVRPPANSPVGGMGFGTQ
jgi:hypothetical protein